MGFLKTLVKTAVTWDPQYVKRYEYSQVVKEALLELRRNDRFTAYLRNYFKTPSKIIDCDTDLSDELLHDIAIEIDLKNQVRKIYVGILGADSQFLDDWKNKKISSLELGKYYRTHRLYRYDNSFELYRDIKKVINSMILSQGVKNTSKKDDSLAASIDSGEDDDLEKSVYIAEDSPKSPFVSCPMCRQKLNIVTRGQNKITCPTCSHVWVTNT